MFCMLGFGVAASGVPRIRRPDWAPGLLRFELIQLVQYLLPSERLASSTVVATTHAGALLLRLQRLFHIASPHSGVAAHSCVHAGEGLGLITVLRGRRVVVLVYGLTTARVGHCTLHPADNLCCNKDSLHVFVVTKTKPMVA